MEAYFVLVAVVILIYLVPIKKSTKVIIISLVLIVFSGFREGVGTDFNMYKNIFYNIDNLDGYYLGEIETGYILLNKFIYSMYSDHRLLFIITSTVIIGLICISIMRYSKNYLLSILLFICLGYLHSSFNGVRQYIALAIFIYSIRFIINKKVKSYLIFILVASLFHKTILITLPLYFINKIKFNKKVFILSIIPIMLIGVFYEPIMNNFSMISPFYYEKYMKTMYLSQNTGIGGRSSYIYIASYICVYILSIFRYEKIVYKYKDCIIFIILCGISIPFMILGLKNQLFFRLSLYFSVNFIFLIPMLLDSFSKNIRLIIYHPFIMWVVFFYYTTLMNRDGVIPYIWMIGKN